MIVTRALSHAYFPVVPPTLPLLDGAIGALDLFPVTRPPSTAMLPHHLRTPHPLSPAHPSNCPLSLFPLSVCQNGFGLVEMGVV